MLDVEAPSSQHAVEQLSDERVKRNPHRIAMWSTGNTVTAGDLVGDALVRVLDPEDAPWKPPPPPTFLSHMALLIRQVWDQQMRKAAIQREVLDGGIAQDETRASDEPLADEMYARLELLTVRHALLDRVLVRLADKHPRVREVYDLGKRGVDEPAEQALALGCPIEEVYVAIRTLKDHRAKGIQRLGRGRGPPNAQEIQEDAASESASGRRRRPSPEEDRGDAVSTPGDGIPSGARDRREAPRRGRGSADRGTG